MKYSASSVWENKDEYDVVVVGAGHAGCEAARFESRRLHERAQAMLPLIVPIFLSAFKRADELAMAMEARGYRGARGRTRKKSVPLPLSGWGALALCALVCAAEILL